jgi:hypothetical protein
VLRLEARDRLPAVAERADDHVTRSATPACSQMRARDLRVRRAELDRCEVRAGRHHARGPQRAVAAVGAELEQPSRLARSIARSRIAPFSSPTFIMIAWR